MTELKAIDISEEFKKILDVLHKTIANIIDIDLKNISLIIEYPIIFLDIKLVKISAIKIKINKFTIRLLIVNIITS